MHDILASQCQVSSLGHALCSVALRCTPLLVLPENWTGQERRLVSVGGKYKGPVDPTESSHDGEEGGEVHDAHLARYKTQVVHFVLSFLCTSPPAPPPPPPPNHLYPSSPTPSGPVSEQNRTGRQECNAWRVVCQKKKSSQLSIST